MEEEKVDELLNSSRKKDIKKGISLISKYNIKNENFNKVLFEVLQKYLDDEKSWEFNCQIMDILGINQYQPCIQALEKIIKKNLPHDMMTICATRAFCRIKNKNGHDVSEVIKLLKFGGYSTINGALNYLGEDKINPNDGKKTTIIHLTNKFEPKIEKGYTDVRMGLALPCAGWKKLEIVKDFLKSCLESNYIPLSKIAKNSIVGKYTRL